MLAVTSFAGWRYELYGPGSAAWVNEETQETVNVMPGTAAPDGTSAPEKAEVQKPGAGNGQSGGENTAVGNNGNGADAGAAADGNQKAEDSIDQNGAASGENGTANVGETQNQSSGTGSDTQENAAASENPNLVMSNGRQIDLTKPMVALTYDDGPYPAVGNLLMDELAKVNGRATFFMVGNRVAANQAEVQRMVREGHEVANHSWDHQYFNKLGAAAIRSEVARTNEAIAAATGVTPTLMRLPGGNITNTVRENVNMPMIYWSIDTLDWKTRNAQKTIDAVVGKVKDGDIVLMHEIWAQTGTANQTIIPALVKQGFQLVTVSELAKFKGHTLGLGVQYKSFH